MEYTSMNNPSRLPVLFVLATLLLMAVWLVFSTLVVPPLIENAYRGESLPIFNRIISGQAVHPVAHYLTVWRRITYLGLLVPFIISLVVLVTEEEHVRAWAWSRSSLLITMVIMIHLIPLWIFTYFPSQDGPVHLNIANVIRQYYSPDLDVFREYYVLNKDLDPNWATYLVLVSLMYIVPPLVAEKILLSSYIILLPLSTCYALRSIRPTTGLLTLLVSPFIYNNLLHMGFYNFSYSLPMFFFVLGYWLRYRDRLTYNRTFTLAFLSLLLYFCHLVSLVITYTAIILLTMVECAQHIHRRRVDLYELWQAFGTQILPLIYALLPACILALIFLDRQGMTATNRLSAWTLLQGLLNLRVLISYDPFEVWCSRALVVLFVIVTFSLFASKVVHRHRGHWNSFFLVVIAYIVIYFIAPNAMSNGSEINVRLSLYPFLALILWFEGHSLSKMKEWRMAIYALGIALMLLGLHTIQYVTLNSFLEEYLSGTHLIAPNTTLLSLVFSKHTGEIVSGAPSPFLHASGYIAAQRNIIALSNYQPTTGSFPIIFRPHLTPPLHIAIVNERRHKSSLEAGSDALQNEPPDVDFLTYPHRTGGHVDYVLVWDVRQEQHNLEATHSIFRQLQAHYELIYTSPRRGLMQLYRWKNGKKE
jgi:hypothetical protein